MTTTFKILPLVPSASRYTFTLGTPEASQAYVFIVKFNYTLSLWTLSIEDALGNSLVAGLALIPGHSLLARFPSIASVLGNLVLIEKTSGDYAVQQNLGQTVLLLWFPPDTEVIIPT